LGVLSALPCSECSSNRSSWTCGYIGRCGNLPRAKGLWFASLLIFSVSTPCIWGVGHDQFCNNVCSKPSVVGDIFNVEITCSMCMRFLFILSSIPPLELLVLNHASIHMKACKSWVQSQDFGLPTGMFIRFCFLNLVLQQYCLTLSVWKLATIAILFSSHSIHKCLVL
jgi:hypothetical protein